MVKSNDLNFLKKEFLELGVELDLIDKQKKDDIEFRLSRINIDIDNTLPSRVIAITRLDDDVYTIYINPRDRIYTDEMFRDEVVFAEIAHIINDIYRDLYVYHSSEIINFTREQRDKHGYPVSEESLSSDSKDLGKGRVHSWPTQGPALLEECISQYISNMMVSRKYNTQLPLEGKTFIVNSALLPRLFFHDAYSDYSLKLNAADVFSKTLYRGDDSMKKMCRDSLSDCFLDNMFSKYKNREDGEKTLFDIFSFMGSYNSILSTKKKVADGPAQFAGRNYDKKGYKIVPKENEEKAKTLLFSILEKELQEK